SATPAPSVASPAHHSLKSLEGRPQNFAFPFSLFHQTSTHRAVCASFAARKSGTAVVHSSRRNPHRGSNAHPGGSAVSFGTLPGIGVSFPRSSFGEAASSPCV